MIGSIGPAFPSLSVEKEFLQAIDPPIPPMNPSTIPLPLSDAWYFQVLSKAENLYIAREMCWQLRRDKVTPYLLIPRSQNELVGMVAASAPTPGTGIVDGVTIILVDFDVVLGRIGPEAPAEMCNGQKVPTIVCDESFSFTSVQYVDAIVQALKVGGGNNPLVSKPNPAVVSSLFFSMMRMADNIGNTDSYRASNFLTVRYLQIYQLAYNMMFNNFNPPLPDPKGYLLQSINVQPAPVQGMQTVVDVVFSYVGQSTNTLLRWFCRVDVSGEFPFLVFPLAPYYGN
jgi:hypothetical protein